GGRPSRHARKPPARSCAGQCRTPDWSWGLLPLVTSTLDAFLAEPANHRRTKSESQPLLVLGDGRERHPPTTTGTNPRARTLASVEGGRQTEGGRNAPRVGGLAGTPTRWSRRGTILSNRRPCSGSV